jgi:hypothetical protein
MRGTNASSVWALVFDAGLNLLVALERRRRRLESLQRVS